MTQEEAEEIAMELPSECHCDWVESVTLISDEEKVIAWHEFDHEGGECHAEDF
jgi:hypothetical protein